MIRAAALALLALTGHVAEAACRQALALGLDVSGSVDAREYRLQLEGLAGALQNPEVRALLLADTHVPVRILVFEWSGPRDQTVLLPWTEIDGPAALDAATARIGAVERRVAAPSTGIGAALRHGLALLEEQRPCWNRTLDLSGDGLSNSGPRPQDIPVEALSPGVIVNGLVVGAASESAEIRPGMTRDLAAYYDTHVIHGPGAFVEIARGFRDFEAAMTRKLIRELRSLAIGTPGPDLQPDRQAPQRG